MCVLASSGRDLGDDKVLTAHRPVLSVVHTGLHFMPFFVFCSPARFGILATSGRDLGGAKIATSMPFGSDWPVAAPQNNENAE